MGEVTDLFEVETLVGVARGRVLVVCLNSQEFVASLGNHNRFAFVLAPSALPERLVPDHAVAALDCAVLVRVVKRHDGGAVGNDLLDDGAEVVIHTGNKILQNKRRSSVFSLKNQQISK